jgi:E3 ubiquitin-protein ligase BRE1
MEKDDMNAKSLSTILHLKSLTEQAEKEKEAREQEAKSYEQVSLAARLAENAKERVAEEALKEKKVSRPVSDCKEVSLT